MSLEDEIDALVQAYSAEITPARWSAVERDHVVRAIRHLEKSGSPILGPEIQVLRDFLADRSNDRYDGTTYKTRFKRAVAALVGVILLRHGRDVTAYEEGEYEAILDDVFSRLGCPGNVHKIACEASEEARKLLQVRQLLFG